MFSRLDLKCFHSHEQKSVLEIKWIGLANTLTVRCTYRAQRCKGHSWHVVPPSTPNIHQCYNKACDINNLSIVAAHQTALGYISIKCLFFLMGVVYMSQSGYYYVEASTKRFPAPAAYNTASATLYARTITAWKPFCRNSTTLF